MSERRLGWFRNHDTELLVKLPGESAGMSLNVLDVAARKIPDIWIPAPGGRSKTEECRARLDKETGHSLMAAVGLTIAHRRRPYTTVLQAEVLGVGLYAEATLPMYGPRLVHTPSRGATDGLVSKRRFWPPSRIGLDQHDGLDSVRSLKGHLKCAGATYYRIADHHERSWPRRVRGGTWAVIKRWAEPIERGFDSPFR